MAENKSPAFQFYAENFLNGTADMTASEVGSYIRLLCHQWHKGGLPNDDKRLMQLSGGKKSDILNIKSKFNLDDDGMLRNQRMEKTRDEQKEYREKQKAKADLRWGKKDATASMRHTSGISQSDALHSSSSSSSSEVQQHQHAHEVFGKKLFTEQMNLDKQNLELQLKVPRIITEKDVEEFNRHLQTENKNHVHVSEYLKHLRNWLNTKPDFDKEKTNHNGNNTKNKSDRKIGRLDESTVANFLNRRDDQGNTPTDN
jgi:uncharacterized protein YdaU (DUF1376 family)